ncbi:GFA family protein [Steroidobacter sp. S1-65]|uniref:GFA family protein n=1 Tax=Steroidobacter gossypii TaxID=2805490 RepID=A0ABS1WX58_9GAMM|nr:GFA family protein [Steroidobacter gossypii]MBM0105527.1 GFA family protein [Steroidobacter gossypii]
MSHAASHLQGRCLCGAVTYQVNGPFNMMIHCHCSMCRKHHGSAFATFVGAPLMGFKWLRGEDQIVSYASSEKGRRYFCAHCGSVTPTLIKEMDLALIPAGNLDGDPGIRPQGHVFVGSKAPWYTITDDLPQHEEYPPEFGVGGITRPVVEPREGVVLGSCLCNSIQYEITGKPRLAANCHCSRCRRGRSAAHASNAFYNLDDFRFTRQEVPICEYRVPDAKYFGVAFCTKCGGAVPRISKERNAVVVAFGPLDTDPGAQPSMHIYVANKACWFEITDSIPQYQTLPQT